MNKDKKFYLSKKVGEIEKSNFYEYLAVMIDGWVSISKALESIKKKNKNPYFAEKIDELVTFIDSGDSLSKAMKKIPDIFIDSETAIIEAWENSWSMQNSLTMLSDTLKNKYNLRKKVKGSLTYPMIIMVFLIAAIGIVMVYVIPSIMPLFADADVELPLATQALVATSNFVSGNILLILLVMISAVLIFMGYKKTESGWKFVDSLILEMPLIGTVMKNYILANVAANLGTLFASWIPINKTLILTWRATNNFIYNEAFEDINMQVTKWNKIVDSMMNVSEEEELFPADFLQMLSVWEKTATIDKICKKINNQYTREVNASLEVLTKWIEPIAILIAAAFVLWFAFAIFGAILKITQTL